MKNRKFVHRVSPHLVPLRARNFRFLFLATLATGFGDAIATVALAFAVLPLEGANGLGLVIASRQLASAFVIVIGGVVSDRLPRNRVLVFAAYLQGASQIGTAVVVLSTAEARSSTLPLLAFLAMFWGVGNGLVIPAEVGLVAQTADRQLLPEANALQGLARSFSLIIGPAIGGALVVTVGAGYGLLLDAGSFLACALLMSRVKVSAARLSESESLIGELRQGWMEFVSRDWLWTTVVSFGLGNVFMMFWSILGPAVARSSLGGAGAWAAIATADAVGAVAGGLWMLRYQPRRPLVASLWWSLLYVPQVVVLAAGAPVAVVVATAFAAGWGISVHLALWFTVFQREVPEHAQSRVSSYDTLGSFVLNPLGAAIAGPCAVAFGYHGALAVAAVALVACSLPPLALRSVWRVGAPVVQPEAT